MNISRYIDYTLLSPEATKEDIIKLCEEALRQGYKTVCVQPSRVDLAYDILAGGNTGVTTVVGFPNGASYAGYAFGTNSKVQEVLNILSIHSTCEIDMVINIGALKDGDYPTVQNDICRVKQEVDRYCYSKLKVIIETGALTKEEKKTATKIVCDCGADFVKTSTGMNKCSKPATVEDIQLMYEIVKGTNTLIKASSGIKDYETALALIKAGASRLGTSHLIKEGMNIKKCYVCGKPPSIAVNQIDLCPDCYYNLDCYRDRLYENNRRYWNEGIEKHIEDLKNHTWK